MRSILIRVMRRLYNALLGRLVREEIHQFLISGVVIYGDKSRISVHHSACLCNALLNTNSGSITVGPNAFFGHNVCLLTGTHDFKLRDQERMKLNQKHGRDIVIGRGVWVGSNATILGPCTIGEHSVIAAGSVVTRDVPADTVVAGVPARTIKRIIEIGE